jgi:hypothetical protein
VKIMKGGELGICGSGAEEFQELQEFLSGSAMESPAGVSGVLGFLWEE